MVAEIVERLAAGAGPGIVGETAAGGRLLTQAVSSLGAFAGRFWGLIEGQKKAPG